MPCSYSGSHGELESNPAATRRARACTLDRSPLQGTQVESLISIISGGFLNTFFGGGSDLKKQKRGDTIQTAHGKALSQSRTQNYLAISRHHDIFTVLHTHSQTDRVIMQSLKAKIAAPTSQ